MVLELGAEGCQYNYVVTAHRPTGVQHAAVGRFTAPADLNLLLAKSTRLEIHTLTPEGLQGVVDVPIYGRISALRLFRPPGEACDLLFLLTERCQFCVLAYDAAAGELVTRANGDASDRIGRQVEAGQIVVVDPECRLIGLHLYDGHFKVIPIDDKGALGEAFNMRVDHLKVLDLVFLSGTPTPMIALLYEDTKEARHVQTYIVDLRAKELVEGPWAHTNLDAGAGMLIPVPGSGGAVIVCEDSLVFAAEGVVRSASVRPTLVKAYGTVDADGSRFLLGDFAGRLHLLVLQRDPSTGGVGGLQLETLGRTPQPSCLAYLDSGVVFVGSALGDSQLVRLHGSPPDPAQSASFVEVLDVMPSLGPIVDFCVVDLERQGQGQVVTCSGAGADGSVRIVRSGIGLLEQAAVELPGIKGLWSLRSSYMDAYDTYLVISFVGETRVLGMNADEELDEAELQGLDAEQQTLWCGNTAADQLLQITHSSVRLLDCNTKQVVHEWRPPSGQRIILAAGNPTQAAVATGDGRLSYLELAEEGILDKGVFDAEGTEISCLDLTPVGDDSERATMLVAGTWGMDLLLISLPDLRLVLREPLGAEVIPRSVLFACFEGSPFLLCGLGDGQLLNWRLERGGMLADRKRLALGTKPITLRTFRSHGAAHVFAASDRPTIIHSANRKLLYSNLNEGEISHMTSFSTSSFPDSLAVGKERGMVIGTIDDIQKLHVRSVPLHEQPRRIAHQEATRTLAVICTQATMGGDEGVDSVRLLDDQTFDSLDRAALSPSELACSITSTSFADDPAVYYVVGTALVIPDEPEPTKGRLLVYQVVDTKLHLVHERETRGAVYSCIGFQGRLLCGINSRVQMYRWTPPTHQGGEGPSLAPECSHAGHVLALYLDARGDFVVVGDLMKSVQLLLYKPQENTLEARARDFQPNWMSSVAALDDDTYLGAENSYNLFTVRKNSDAATDEERGRLETVGQYHLGEFVNRFRPGSLVMRLPDSDLGCLPTMLYACVSGALGVVVSLPREQYLLLERLQTAMRKVVKGVGGLDHSQWRAFCNPFTPPGTGTCRQFVDGDLVEQFLDLKREGVEAVMGELGSAASLDAVTRLLEELSRLH